jgi:hypothetical protein
VFDRAGVEITDSVHNGDGSSAVHSIQFTMVTDSIHNGDGSTAVHSEVGFLGLHEFSDRTLCSSALSQAHAVYAVCLCRSAILGHNSVICVFISSNPTMNVGIADMLTFAEHPLHLPTPRMYLVKVFTNVGTFV